MHQNNFHVATYLAWRYFRRSSIWMTVLIIFIMTLTFLNLVAASGILVGIIDGASEGYRKNYSGEILVSTLPEKNYIERSTTIRETISNTPGVEATSERYIAFGNIEANYGRTLNQRNTLTDQVGAQIAGINPAREKEVTEFHNFILEGRFLTNADEGKVVVGANLIEQYTPGTAGFDTISTVSPGDDIRITIEGSSKEFEVIGIVKSKGGAADRRVYMTDIELRKIIGRFDYNLDEIAIKLDKPESARAVQNLLINQGVGKNALVRTWEESQGSFLEDIRTTFSALGNMFGGIALAVASITVFIVIFINVLSRRRYIGILKGIGITEEALEASYVLLASMYAILGIGLGLIIMTTVLVPYFQANPLDFPFSDGVLTVNPKGLSIRVGLIMIATIISGYIPARMITHKNTLNTILGR